MVRIRIPATTANLGPGYDCMGLALDLWNTFELHLQAPGLGVSVDTHGEGQNTLPRDKSNLVAAILCDELDRMGLKRPERIHIVAHNAVPCASGLGSSSTAVLAGVIFAQSLWQNHLGQDPAALDKNKILQRAVEIEGHGDNVAPALLGGFVIVLPDDQGVITSRIPHVPTKAVVCVPDFDYPTSKAREALPFSYSKADAIFNIGRAMLVAEALRQGDDALLARAMADKLHEPYRLPQIPGALQAKQAALACGATAAALTGAGPGMIAFAPDHFDRIGRAMKEAYAEAGLHARYWILEATPAGTTIGRLPV